MKEKYSYVFAPNNISSFLEVSCKRFGVGNPSAPHSLYDIAVLYSGLMLTGYIHVYVYSLSLSHPRSYHKMLISHLNSICSHVYYLKSLTPYETLGREERST